MATVADVIKRAMRSLVVLPSGATPTAQEYTDHIETLNGMLNLWSTELMAFAPAQVSGSVAADTASVTVGSGSDIDTTRPVKIVSAYLRDSNSIDYPLDIRSINEYEDVALKTVGSLPEIMYIRKGNSEWTLYFDTKTDTSYTLILEVIQPLATYSASTDTITAPAEYMDALVYNLALRIAPEYGVKNIQLVAGLAQNSLAKIKTLNVHPIPVIKTCASGRSNIYAGV